MSSNNPIRIGIEVDTGQTGKLVDAAKSITGGINSMTEAFMKNNASAKDMAAGAISAASAFTSASPQVKAHATEVLNLKTALAQVSAGLKETESMIIEAGGAEEVGASLVKQYSAELSAQALIQKQLTASMAEYKASLSEAAAGQAQVAESAQAQTAAQSAAAAATSDAAAATARNAAVTDEELAALYQSGIAIAKNATATRDVTAANQAATTASAQLSTNASRMGKSFLDSGIASNDLASALRNQGFSADDVAIAMRELGIAEETEAAAGAADAETKIGSLTRAFAYSSGRIAAYEAGVGQLGFAFARLGAISDSLAPILASAFAVFAIVAFIQIIAQAIEKISKMKDAVQQLSYEYGNWAENAVKQTAQVYEEETKLAEETDKLYKLPSMNGPAEAADEARLKIMQMNDEIAKSIDELGKLLEQKNIGYWQQFWSGAANTNQFTTALKGPVQDALEAMNKFREAEAQQILDKEQNVSKQQLDADQKAVTSAREVANQKLKDLGNVASAQKKNYDDEIARQTKILAPGPGNVLSGGWTPDQVRAKFQPALDMISQTTLGIQAMRIELGQEPKVAEAYTTKGAADQYKNSTERLTTFYRNAIEKMNHEHPSMGTNWQKYYADLAAQSEKASKEIDAVFMRGERERMAIQDRDAKQQTDNNIAEAKRQEAQAMAISRSGDRGKGPFAEYDRMEKTQEAMAQISQTIQDLTSKMQAIENKPFLGEQDEADVKKYQATITSLRLDLEKLAVQMDRNSKDMIISWKGIQDAMKDALTQGVDSFNSGFIKMLEHGQSFARTMQQAWTSLATSFITSVMKMAEAWIGAEIKKYVISTTLSKQQKAQSLADDVEMKFSAARTAAAKAMTSVPFPLDLIVAPIVFAAALAFDKGGIVPGVSGNAVPAVVHAGEMVLPPKVANFIQTAATNGNGGPSVNIHYAPTVNAISTRGMQDALREHGELVTSLVMTEMRKRNAA